MPIYKEWTKTIYTEGLQDAQSGVVTPLHLLQVFDHNRDGIIAQEELNARLDALKIGVPTTVKKMIITKWDSNGDGSVTVSEAATALPGLAVSIAGSVTEQNAMNVF